MLRNIKYILVLLSFIASQTQAAVVPEYADNRYDEHTLSRSEKKCIEEGYKITYANCTQQTAPIDRCPYHDSYYRSCSAEQWCRNNNYSFSEDDCQRPTYPIKQCDNKQPLYRACKEDIAKACEEAGYTSKLKCQLTDKRCPFNADFGKCCDSCPNFSHDINNIPAGYIADGDVCITCDGTVKTNIIEAPCDGFLSCPYGPLSEQTASCLKGAVKLYSACKTAEMTCREQGYTHSSCQDFEDEESCLDNADLKKCHTNCYKLAVKAFPDTDIIAEDVTDPVLDVNHTSLMSLYGEISSECISQQRPEVKININDDNLPFYKELFNRHIKNINFIVNFDTPVSLPFNGTFENVRITVTGNQDKCTFSGKRIEVDGTLSLIDVNNVCADIAVNASSKFITTGNVTGNIDMGKNTSLGVKGNLVGGLQSSSYSEIYIKGILKTNDLTNTSIDSASLLFGCNSRTKIVGGIVADTSNVVLKQYAFVDTPYIKLISTGNNLEVPNSLSSIHLYKAAKLVSIYDETEYPLIENDNADCDDKYAVFLGSAVNVDNQSTSLEPSNLLPDLWKCKNLTRTQMECN
jgi:hypothetical protein